MDTQSLLLLLPVAPPFLLGLAAARAFSGDRDLAWRRVEKAALSAVLGGSAALVAVLHQSPITGMGLRVDAAGAVVTLVVGFLGWVIVRYSHRYLHGENNERRYLRLLASTLAAVLLVLAADHLLLLAAAWIASSLALHPLLRFYTERPAARLAAHQKFLSARAADLALLGAVALLGTAYGTLSVNEMIARAAGQGVPPLAHAGLFLLVLTSLLKCAQMPLHGWLIQAMEAPTPVSALLHAGVVNLGGFVLIRCSPLLAQAPAALVLLATVATLTVIGATLVMGTRVSVKVALAWSTVAQMGFMLLQVAIGLPAMALLHLVAHSLYKAHAFLAAGGVVQRQQQLRLAPGTRLTAARWGLAAALAPAAILGAGIYSGSLTTPATGVAGAVLGLALVPLAASGRVAAAATVALSWFAGHTVAAWLIAMPVFDVPAALLVAVTAALLVLFAAQAAVSLMPAWPRIRRLYSSAYGGFYIDERVSRVLFRYWPVPEATVSTPPVSASMSAVR